MSFASDAPALPFRIAQIRWVLHEFWATCLETASLFRQGVTPAVLAVWALLLIMVALHMLGSETCSHAQTSERQALSSHFSGTLQRQ